MASARPRDARPTRFSYDALVGAAASQHGLRLCTRDRRAAETYRSLDVDFELLGEATG